MKSDNPRVLLVDDDAGLLQLIAMRLDAAGFDVTAVSSGEQALASLAVSRPQVVVTDLRMHGMDGLALFDAIHRQAPALPVVILTAHGTIADAVAATRRGVYGFLTKPFDSAQLLETVAGAARVSSTGSCPGQSWRSEVITRAPAMQDLLQQAQLVAGSDASVCVYGPSGCGKELLARAIHRASRRAERPFVAVNCAAIPEGLLESELFGHKKGSFTGEISDRHGPLTFAEGGTLFLDEIGEMQLALQLKLLRALDERVVRPVGTKETMPVDVRVVAATSRGLEERIAAGEFREDLFYRLNVVKLVVPSLAERREDIPLLAAHFLGRFAQRPGPRAHALSPEAMDVLVGAAWPGNVRQLANVLEQAAALATTQMIPATLLRQAIDDERRSLAPLDQARREFERDYLVRILKITAGNVTHAARLAGRNRTEFYRLLERHALEPSMFKQAG